MPGTAPGQARSCRNHVETEFPVDFAQLRESALKLCKLIGSPTSGSLAYTCFCLVALIYALCLATMPDRVLDQVSLLSYFR